MCENCPLLGERESGTGMTITEGLAEERRRKERQSRKDAPLAIQTPENFPAVRPSVLSSALPAPAA